MVNYEEFEPLSWWREILLDNKQLPDYYNAKRKYLHDKGESIKGIEWRRNLHGILLKLMELDREYINRQSLKILNDKRKKTDKPVIYAITHIGKFDYQIVSEAIKDHQIPFSGDPESMYRTFDGMLLGLNGIIYCDTENKTDRKVAFDTSIELLDKGHNLLIYPEGVWNLTPNLLALPLFPGIIRMALKTGCDIVPVAVEQYDKDFIVNIGENFKVDNVSFESKEAEDKYVDEKKFELRDSMATLKWEIFESLPIQERSKIGDYAQKNKEFADERLNEWFNNKENKPYYDMELVSHRTFKEKKYVSPKEAFEYFNNIDFNKNNAFMMRRDSSLPDEYQNIIDEKVEEYKKSGR